MIRNLTRFLIDERHFTADPSVTPEKVRIPFNTSVSTLVLDRDDGKLGHIIDFGDTSHLGAQLEVVDQNLR